MDIPAGAKVRVINRRSAFAGFVGWVEATRDLPNGVRFWLVVFPNHDEPDWVPFFVGELALAEG